MHLLEKYREEYDALTVKNISFEDFARLKEKFDIKTRRAMQEYGSNIKNGDQKFNNVEIKKPQNAIPRTIIIDGPNIMHGGSTDRDTRENSTHQKIPDVNALFSIIRYFAVRNFEVFAVISSKYSISDVTNFKKGIDALVENNLCVITPTTNLDDTLALDLAAQVNGLVLTADLYRDHAFESDRYRRIVQENRLEIDWEEVKNEWKNTRTVQDDDYLARKRFVFKSGEHSYMSNQELNSRLFVFPDDIYYPISKERIEMSKPEENKPKIIALLNGLIVEGLQATRDNVQKILATPVHSSSYMDLSDPSDDETESFDDDNENDVDDDDY